MANCAVNNTGRRVLLAGRIAVTAIFAVMLASAANAQTAPAAAKPAASAASSESALKQRVESLEEQLVDMQVVIGTLESLAKSGGASSTPAFSTPVSSGADSARIATLEKQLSELSVQVQRLTEEVHTAGLPTRSDSAVAAAAEAPTPSFGSTTVTRANDAIGGLIANTAAEAAPAPGAVPGQAPGALPSPVDVQQSPTLPVTPAAAGEPGATLAPVATAALPPNVETGDPKQLYEAAYGYLLQRDYGAAETAFGEFLRIYPNDSLAGNAQYWLGETHFVRGQYKSAAGAFLKGYQTYTSGAKAPDSLLKLAMSLDRLGQKDAACSSFAELQSKFPNAPQSVKSRAKSEQQRVGCP